MYRIMTDTVLSWLKNVINENNSNDHDLISLGLIRSLFDVLYFFGVVDASCLLNILIDSEIVEMNHILLRL